MNLVAPHEERELLSTDDGGGSTPWEGSSRMPRVAVTIVVVAVVVPAVLAAWLLWPEGSDTPVTVPSSATGALHDPNGVGSQTFTAPAIAGWYVYRAGFEATMVRRDVTVERIEPIEVDDGVELHFRIAYAWKIKPDRPTKEWDSSVGWVTQVVGCTPYLNEVTTQRTYTAEGRRLVAEEALLVTAYWKLPPEPGVYRSRGFRIHYVEADGTKGIYESNQTAFELFARRDVETLERDWEAEFGEPPPGFGIEICTPEQYDRPLDP